MTLLLNIGDRETINSHLAGRLFDDVLPAHQRVTVRCQDGYEVDVDWSSAGPELRDARQRILQVRNEYALPVEFAYCRGKRIRQCVTDGSFLMLQMTDGHELVIRWVREPDARAVNVTVHLQGVSMTGGAN